MRKHFLQLLTLVTIVISVSCNNSSEEKVVQEKLAPLSITENSGPFNESFNKLLSNYYTLKDAFVESDVDKVNAAAQDLIGAGDNLKTDEIQGDSTGMIRETAHQFVSVIRESSASVAAAQDIEAKRRDFETITDALWSLTRTVQYSGEKVYYQYCPMAFNDKGAYWLSNSAEIRNPYFGDKMLKCGEVADSLDYSKR